MGYSRMAIPKFDMKRRHEYQYSISVLGSAKTGLVIPF
jgi:hypothetical protein